MSNFLQNIADFKKTGDYTYKFDDVGNLIFNSASVDFSQVYLAFPLTNTIYDNSKIASFYDLNFKEFIPTSITNNNLNSNNTSSVDNLQQQLTTIQQENVALKDQLDTIIEQVNNNSSAADSLVIKQVILDLRKSLKQGQVDSDFSDTFPYTAINPPTI